MLLVYTVIGSTIVTGIILGRWLFSRSAWPHHPRGSSGFLHDEFLRLGAIYVPYAIALLGVRYYTYDLHPELARSPIIYVVILTFFVFRRLSRFIPFVREAGKRIDAARASAREAKT
jgi:hypothetical protein